MLAHKMESYETIPQNTSINRLMNLLYNFDENIFIKAEKILSNNAEYPHNYNILIGFIALKDETASINDYLIKLINTNYTICRSIKTHYQEMSQYL